jgi:hypothetical protein
MRTLEYYLLVILVLFFLLTVNSVGKKYSKYSFLVLYVILVLIVGFRGPGVDHDYTSYLHAMLHDDTLILEPTFKFLSSLIYNYSLPYTTLFVVYAALGIGIKLIAINKFSEFQIIALLVYMSNFFLLHDINQIRTGVATAILLFAIPYLAQKKYLYYLAAVFVAYLFHFSSLLAVVLLFLTDKQINASKRILWGLIPLIGFLLHFAYIDVFSFIPVREIQIKLEVYKSVEEAGLEGYATVNLFNLYYLFKLFIYYFLLFNYKLIVSKQYPYFSLFFKIYAISIIVFPVLSSFTPILGYRSSELLGIIEVLLFPYLFLCFKSVMQTKIFVILYVVLLVSINIIHKTLIHV